MSKTELLQTNTSGKHNSMAHCKVTGNSNLLTIASDSNLPTIASNINLPTIASNSNLPTIASNSNLPTIASNSNLPTIANSNLLSTNISIQVTNNGNNLVRGKIEQATTVINGDNRTVQQGTDHSIVESYSHVDIVYIVGNSNTYISSSNGSNNDNNYIGDNELARDRYSFVVTMATSLIDEQDDIQDEIRPTNEFTDITLVYYPDSEQIVSNDNGTQVNGMHASDINDYENNNDYDNNSNSNSSRNDDSNNDNNNIDDNEFLEVGYSHIFAIATRLMGEQDGIQDEVTSIDEFSGIAPVYFADGEQNANRNDGAQVNDYARFNNSSTFMYPSDINYTGNSDDNDYDNNTDELSPNGYSHLAVADMSLDDEPQTNGVSTETQQETAAGVNHFINEISDSRDSGDDTVIIDIYSNNDAYAWISGDNGEAGNDSINDLSSNGYSFIMNTINTSMSSIEALDETEVEFDDRARVIVVDNRFSDLTAENNGQITGENKTTDENNDQAATGSDSNNNFESVIDIYNYIDTCYLDDNDGNVLPYEEYTRRTTVISNVSDYNDNDNDNLDDTSNDTLSYDAYNRVTTVINNVSDYNNNNNDNLDDTSNDTLSYDAYSQVTTAISNVSDYNNSDNDNVDDTSNDTLSYDAYSQVTTVMSNVSDYNDNDNDNVGDTSNDTLSYDAYSQVTTVMSNVSDYNDNDNDNVDDISNDTLSYDAYSQVTTVISIASDYNDNDNDNVDDTSNDTLSHDAYSQVTTAISNVSDYNDNDNDNLDDASNDTLPYDAYSQVTSAIIMTTIMTM